MRAIDFEDIQVGDKVVVFMEDMNTFYKHTVVEINENDRCVNDSNYIDIYPNEDDQYIIINY